MKMVEKARKYASEHRVVLVCAVMAGLLSVLPHILAVHTLGGDYQSIPFMYADNEEYYLARIGEILDGHGFVASPYLYEYKGSLPLVPPIGEYFYIPLLFTGSLLNALVFAKFLFPAVLFLLVYALMRRLLKEIPPRESILAGIAGAAFVVLGYGLVGYQDILQRLLHGTTYAQISLWTRPVNPITGALLLFTFLILLYDIRRASRAHLVALALILAGIVGYFFSFALAGLILGTLIVFSFLLRTDDWKKQLAVGIGAITIVGAYVLAISPSLGGGTLGRNGFITGHMALLNKIVLLSSLLFSAIIAYAYYAHRVHPFRHHTLYRPLYFAAAFLVAGFIALNQQIITGLSIWPYHFVQYTIPLSVIAVLVALAILVRPRFQKLWATLMFVIIAASFAFSIWNAAAFTAALGDFRKRQEFAPAFSWLKENAPHDCTVLTAEDYPQDFNHMIPAFTQCNTYATRYLMGFAPHERVLHNYLVLMRLNGVSPGKIEEYSFLHPEWLRDSFYESFPDALSTDRNEHLIALMPTIKQRYEEFYAGDLKRNLEKYRIDYLITTDDLDVSVFESLPLKMEFSANGITVYSLE